MGPLAGLKIVEFAAVGPAPMCAMLLADLGATVLRIDRVTPVELGSKRPLPVRPAAAQPRVDGAGPEERRRPAPWRMEVVASADALIEGMRPGVMERLGPGPGRSAWRATRSWCTAA